MSVQVTKLRALFGEWDDGKAIFLGAVEEYVYEAICEDDEQAGTNGWEERCQGWIDRGPMGIGETREATIAVHLDGKALFAVPAFPAQAEPAGELKERDHGE